MLRSTTYVVSIALAMSCGCIDLVHADAVSDATYQSNLALFADPTTAPTGTVGPSIEVKAGVKATTVTYSSAKGHMVTGLLFSPSSASASNPAPILILLHGLGGRKEQMAPLGEKGAVAGYASFAIDLAGQGARGEPDGSTPTFQTEGDLAKTLVTDTTTTVVDLRRALDYLATLPYLDSKHVCVIGGSLGALEGTVFAGVEPRVTAVVLISGGGDIASLLQEQANTGVSLGGHFASLFSGVPLTTIRSQLAAIEPDVYAPHISPRPLFMQNGKLDDVIPPAYAQSLFASAGDPKQIVWLPDSGHNPPPDTTIANVTQFLARVMPAKQAVASAITGQ